MGEIHWKIDCNLKFFCPLFFALLHSKSSRLTLVHFHVKTPFVLVSFHFSLFSHSLRAGEIFLYVFLLYYILCRLWESTCCCCWRYWTHFASVVVVLAADFFPSKFQRLSTSNDDGGEAKYSINLSNSDGWMDESELQWLWKLNARNTTGRQKQKYFIRSGKCRFSFLCLSLAFASLRYHQFVDIFVLMILMN